MTILRFYQECAAQKLNDCWSTLYLLHMKYLIIACLLAALISAEITQIEVDRCNPAVTCSDPKKIPDGKGCRCVCATNTCTGAYQIQNKETCQCQCREGRTYNGATAACECVLQICNDSQIWDASQCRCKCNGVPTVCPTGQVWSYKACGCALQCPEGQAPDATGATCQCTSSAPTNGCGTDKVWNAQTCRCECTTSASSCLTTQFLNKDTCQCQLKCPQNKQPDATNTTCECRNSPPAAGCSTNANILWNTEKCRCDCQPASFACQSGFSWSQNSCSCRIQCTGNKRPDTAGTACVCPNAQSANNCGANRVWNESTCKCDCSPASTTCQPNFFWSAQRCSCVCNLRCQRPQNLDRTNCICRA